MTCQVRMRIDRPIFIIGSGRSGTTIFYDLMALHPDVTWFSHISNRYPAGNKFLHFHRLLDTPLLGRSIKRHILSRRRIYSPLNLRPSEGEDIYEGLCGLEDGRRTTEEDYDPDKERLLKDVIIKHLEVSGKARFLNKRTSNTQRIRLLNRMFPDAIYIHMIRDGRAVASSYLNVDWWDDVVIWWLGIRPQEWAAQGKEPIALCALQWKHNVREILDNRELLENYIEVRYEDLVRSPRKIIGEVLDICGLQRYDEHMALVPEGLPDMNRKWRETLTPEQKKAVEDSVGDLLDELGYTD
jgi:hypothetical protein